ncbi:hypothetical protein POTOM_013700 [Populus tomentosa]|uniref:J domain-containing protein n=1 Tax=Populus tomentosa TaxID=118781 RepID=A0A8X8A598_POPTO|nr:hypothetical protein POTOM_013700 [Populus tomentosa]
MGTKADQEEQARRLKTIAETKFTNSNLKSALKHAKKAHRLSPKLEGLSSMLTALKTLRVASKTQNSDITDWYKILQVEPFSHMNTIKKQYKKLALVLHPDKNPFLGCEEAFKLVAEGFRVLSDKIRRKEYDLRLRIRLQDERVSDNSAVETFWTACSRCRLLHQFERQYLGHNLVCPSCKKSFEAVEVKGGDKKDAEVGVWSERLRRKDIGGKGIGGLSSGEGVSVGSRRELDAESAGGVNLKGNEVISGEWGGGKLRTGGLRRRTSTVGEVLERSKKRVKFSDETMTLAEMKLEAKKKASRKKVELKEKQKDAREKEKKKEKQKVMEKEKGKGKGKETCLVLNKSTDLATEKGGASKKSGDTEIKTREGVKTSRKMEIMRQGASRKSASLQMERHKNSRGDLDSMAVEHSNFFDFDSDRVERRFKKGQVWAIYDDDGMPRHYGLIDEVVSVNPFKVNLSWLDPQRYGDEVLIWEKMGLHVSCGRFKVARTMIIDSVNIFSHAVECEREAREVYRIYPKKGSVWALYNEATLAAEGRNLSASDERCNDIVVLLTTYSEMHGLSIAYLEKVDGYKTVFKRREIGCHAIRLLEKDDIWLFSHQIPSRKFSGDEVADNLKDCWELDPASIPSNLLNVGGEADNELHSVDGNGVVILPLLQAPHLQSALCAASIDEDFRFDEFKITFDPSSNKKKLEVAFSRVHPTSNHMRGLIHFVLLQTFGFYVEPNINSGLLLEHSIALLIDHSADTVAAYENLQVAGQDGPHAKTAAEYADK